MVLARKSGDKWFLGVMTNATKTEFTIDLSFLPEGEFKAVSWQDGVNADKHPSDYKKQVQKLARTTKLVVATEKGGGYVAIITP